MEATFFTHTVGLSSAVSQVSEHRVPTVTSSILAETERRSRYRKTPTVKPHKTDSTSYCWCFAVRHWCRQRPRRRRRRRRLTVYRRSFKQLSNDPCVSASVPQVGQVPPPPTLALQSYAPISVRDQPPTSIQPFQPFIVAAGVRGSEKLHPPSGHSPISRFRTRPSSAFMRFPVVSSGIRNLLRVITALAGTQSHNTVLHARYVNI